MHKSMFAGVLRRCAAAAFVASVVAPSLANGQETYAERMVYDPETREWTVEPPPEPGTDVGDLEIAKRELNDGKPRFAQRQLKEWLKFYGADSALHPEAVYQLGRAEFELGNYMAAHEYYRVIMDTYPGTEWAEKAARADFLVAEVFLAGKRRKIAGMPMLTARDEGVDILDQISIDFEGQPIAAEAIKTKADYYYKRGEFDFAEDAYARLARDYPNSQYARFAMLRSAESALGQFGGIDFDSKPLVEAEERFDLYKARYQQVAEQDEQVDLLRTQIDNERAHKEYEIGKYYRRTGKLGAAAYYYKFVMRQWPGTTWAELAEEELRQIQPMVDMQNERQQPADDVDDVQRTPFMEDGDEP